MMIKEKSLRFLRRVKRNFRAKFFLLLPALLVLFFLAFLLLSVGLSRDNSFKACSIKLTQCAGEKPPLFQVAKCSSKVALCDVEVLWLKLQGKSMPAPDLAGLPVVNEKADKALFENLTKDEFLKQRFEEFHTLEQEENLKKSQESSEELQEYMQKAREERELFEKKQEMKRKMYVLEKEQNASQEKK